MHIKRGRDTSPSIGYRGMPTCQMSRESRRSRDGERLASVPSPPDPWLISHEIPTLAKPVNRGGSSRTMFRAARPGWLVVRLGWHVAFPRGMAGIFHPGFFNVAYQTHHQEHKHAVCNRLVQRYHCTRCRHITYQLSKGIRSACCGHGCDMSSTLVM